MVNLKESFLARKPMTRGQMAIFYFLKFLYQANPFLAFYFLFYLSLEHLKQIHPVLLFQALCLYTHLQILIRIWIFIQTWSWNFLIIGCILESTRWCHSLKLKYLMLTSNQWGFHHDLFDTTKFGIHLIYWIQKSLIQRDFFAI